MTEPVISRSYSHCVIPCMFVCFYKDFFDLLPNLKKSVSEAEFITIDLEFTGLTSAGRDMDGMPFDTPRQYYEKVYQRALEFLPLQLGLCLFQYDSKGDR